jgi:hypothetical protein
MMTRLRIRRSPEQAAGREAGANLISHTSLTNW